MFKIVSIIAASLLIMAFTNNEELSGKLPHNPEIGKCYTRVVVPATYNTVKETVMTKPETNIIKSIPAKFAFENKEVIINEAFEKSYIEPAQYKIVKEKVLVRDEERKLIPTPAKFKVISKKILVTPASTGWKKGSGPIQKVNNSTGEILCFTKTPAKYKTVKERVLVSEASIQEKIIPASYKTITKKVLVKAEKVVKKIIPATTKIVKVKRLIEPATKKNILVEPVYKTVNKRILLTKASSEWRSILCNTNASKSSIREIQSRLSHSGYYKGPIDGIYGKQTSAAVKKFQTKFNLASGGLTRETLNKLKVKWPSKSINL